MKEKINSYFAILLITIAGSGATLIIVHVATSDTLIAAFQGTASGNYASLQKSILK